VSVPTCRGCCQRLHCELDNFLRITELRLMSLAAHCLSTDQTLGAMLLEQACSIPFVAVSGIQLPPLRGSLTLRVRD
jgi:hypothetical protein